MRCLFGSKGCPTAPNVQFSKLPCGSQNSLHQRPLNVRYPPCVFHPHPPLNRGLHQRARGRFSLRRCHRFGRVETTTYRGRKTALHRARIAPSTETPREYLLSWWARWVSSPSRKSIRLLPASRNIITCASVPPHHTTTEAASKPVGAFLGQT